ncbi:MAG: leucine-rich repeat protein [Clostridiales bacterium]|nr:leucine-rich repeat protein [Clostridiales bacterium]
MKKRILLLVIMILIFNCNCLQVHAKEEFTPLNPVIDVGNKMYVQHDESNNDVYDLQKSETGTTTVYEVILPKFTANKAWTNKGEYIDNFVKKENGFMVPHGATAPEDYIPVKEGEKYFIKAYGVGGNGKKADGTFNPYYAPVLFFDDNNKFICDRLTDTFSKSKAGVEVIVPKGATRMHLTDYNHQNFTIQRILELTDAEFDALPIIKKDEIQTKISQTYEEYQKDPTLYKKPDKAYITFVNDDTRSGIDEFADLFISKKVPLVLATVPNALLDNASAQKETRLDVARRVEAAGGEIMAHNAAPLTKEGFTDYNTMYSFFIRMKQTFNYYGFDVNGIILSGGAGQVTGAKESEEWASSFYSYSDLYGVEYKQKEIALDSVYYHRRGGLGNFQNDVEKIKQSIDKAIEEKSWTVFYFHDANEITTDTLGQVLDYVNSKSDSEIEVVTYKEMYQKNAEKESVIKNTSTTYYVSSTGTSAKGTDENAPMSYETAKSKTYLSGDTILFKKGDTFYGTFNPKIVKVNDKITTISSYGKGEMPNITGYKIADSKDSWQLHTEGIYKINLTDTQYFKGLTTTDGNSANIGFLEDKMGVKYFNKKSKLDEMEEEYDFYCDGTYLYIKSNENPYDKLGELKLATRTNLFTLKSNLKIKNIRFSGTGAHGLAGSGASTENVQISNNIIEDIGGSYLKGTIRYGNGIEFYGTDVSDVAIKNNIIRNVYDVGFTIQGTSGSGQNVVVRDNVFVSNSQDSEIWESGSATGIHSYQFTNNISINQGRGWGYDARPDKYVAAHILFWQYLIEDTDIYFHHNIVYNPRRLYFIEQTNGTNVSFKENDYIKSDYNKYYCTDETTIFRDSYKIAEKDTFIAEYKKDTNSTFTLLEVDEDIVKAAASDDRKMIKQLFEIEEEDDSEDMETVEETDTETDDNTESKNTETESTKSEKNEGQNNKGNGKTENEIIGEAEKPQDTAPKAGTEFTDTKTKAVYRIINPEMQNGTVEYVKNANKNAKSITIPDTVTYENITYKVTDVAAKALKGNKKITRLTIGKNVKKIGTSAFQDCRQLKFLTIKTKHLTSKNVGKKAFSGIQKKAKIKVPAGRNKSYKKLLRKRGISSKAVIK